MHCVVESHYIFDPNTEMEAAMSFKKTLDKSGLTYKEDLSTIAYIYTVTDNYSASIKE